MLCCSLPSLGVKHNVRVTLSILVHSLNVTSADNSYVQCDILTEEARHRKRREFVWSSNGFTVHKKEHLSRTNINRYLIHGVQLPWVPERHSSQGSVLVLHQIIQREFETPSPAPVTVNLKSSFHVGEGPGFFVVSRNVRPYRLANLSEALDADTFSARTTRICAIIGL